MREDALDVSLFCISQIILRYDPRSLFERAMVAAGGGKCSQFRHFFLAPGKSEKKWRQRHFRHFFGQNSRAAKIFEIDATFATFLRKIWTSKSGVDATFATFFGKFLTSKIGADATFATFLGQFHHRWRKWRWRHFRHFFEKILNLEKWRRRHFRHFFEKILTLKKWLWRHFRHFFGRILR